MTEMRATRKTRSSGKILLVGLVFLGLCIGGVLLGAGLFKTGECRRIQRGSSAAATIVSAKPTEHRGSKGRRYYGIDLVYRFEHGGHAFTGTRLGVEKLSTSDRSYRDDLIQRLRPGAKATAYFEPAHPERAVLDARLTPEIGGMVTAGCGILALTLALPFLGRFVRFYRDDLPINTEAVTGADGVEFYRVLPREQHTAFVVIIILSIAALQIVSLLVLGSGGSVTPGTLAFVSAASVLIAFGGTAAARWLSPRGGWALEVHPADSTLRLRSLTRSGRSRTLPMDRVTGVTLTFKRQKYANKPTSKDAAFWPSLETLTEDGAPRPVKLSRLYFTRENAEELARWLREQLALEVREPALDIAS